MRLADFPLFEPDVYFVRSETSSPAQLKPLAEARVWRDTAGHAWLAQGDVLVELERDTGGKSFQAVLGQRSVVWLLLKQSVGDFQLQLALPSDWIACIGYRAV